MECPPTIYVGQTVGRSWCQAHRGQAKVPTYYFCPAPYVVPEITTTWLTREGAIVEDTLFWRRSMRAFNSACAEGVQILGISRVSPLFRPASTGGPETPFPRAPRSLGHAATRVDQANGASLEGSASFQIAVLPESPFSQATNPARERHDSSTVTVLANLGLRRRVGNPEELVKARPRDLSDSPTRRRRNPGCIRTPAKPRVFGG
jgi:hypothetical protein